MVNQQRAAHSMATAIIEKAYQSINLRQTSSRCAKHGSISWRIKRNGDGGMA